MYRSPITGQLSGHDLLTSGFKHNLWTSMDDESHIEGSHFVRAQNIQHYSLFNAFVFYITFVNLERPQVVFYFHESEAWVKIKYNLGSREIYKCDVKWQKSWISVLLLFVSLFYASFPFVDPMWLRRRRDIKHKDFARSTIKLKEKSWECTSETICETPLKY